jgi:hypothetical protein
MDHGDHHRGHHRDDGDHAADDEQKAAPAGLLGAAFQLPFELALGVFTSLFVGRHGRYASMVVSGGWVASSG